MYLLQSEHIVQVHLTFAWAALAFGILTGAVMGMFFHKENWLGGYNSVQRRLIRLGHIAFFGMAFLNFSFATTIFIQDISSFWVIIGSSGLKLATITMPLICFLSAAKGINRAIFTIPVMGTVALLIAVFSILSQPAAGDLLVNKEASLNVKH